MTRDQQVEEFLSQIEAGRDAYRQGVSLITAGKFTEGIAALREAIRFSPEFPQAYAWLGYAYLEQALYEEPDVALHLWQEALRAAERAIRYEICPLNAWARAQYVIGLVHFKAYGDRDYALQKCNQIRAVNEKFARMLEERVLPT